MRDQLQPGDRKILIACGVVLVALALTGALLWPPSGRSPAPFPSSFSVSSDGAKAAYALVAEMGYSVERWMSPPDELPNPPSGNVILVLADPIIPPSAQERQQLRLFVARGGRILVTGASGVALFSEERARFASSVFPAWQEFSAELPAPLTRRAPKILMKAQVRWPSLLASERRYYGDAQGAVIVSYRMGGGEVVWWADSAPLTNYGLTQASNLMLFLNSLAAPGGSGSSPGRSRVLWDEYFHGQRRNLWSYLDRTPLPWALAQLAVLAFAILFTYGRRVGPLRPLPASGLRLSPLEFIETLGDLYHRKRAASVAVETAYRRFRSELLSRLGLTSAATTEAVYRSVRERLDWKIPGFWETLRDCESAIRSTDLPEEKALSLVQDLHDYARRFGLTTSGRGVTLG